MGSDYTRPLYGWDGTVPRKLAMVWGYSDVYGEQKVNNAHPAGTVTIDFATVPAGEVWKIETLLAMNASGASGTIAFGIMRGGVELRIASILNPALQVALIAYPHATMREGDYLRLIITNTALNDYCIGHVTGYKMKVNQ